ncbi:uncharacterized protein [Haliotis cracherodii]|uniref:uncharacterized protein n=1 Tax=Haliotis cracherodii TaxID=6455 RepID=UPI0039E7D988
MRRNCSPVKTRSETAPQSKHEEKLLPSQDLRRYCSPCQGPGRNWSPVKTRLGPDRSKAVLSDGISVTTIVLGLKDDATTTTTIRNYHLTGSVRDPGVAVLIDNLLTWTQDPERGSSIIVSRTATESLLLVLLVNIASRLKDDGTVDVITDMGRLCARHGGAPFTRDDVRFCLEFSRQFLEILGTYANI